jgi:hypothetical protein
MCRFIRSTQPRAAPDDGSSLTGWDRVSSSISVLWLPQSCLSVYNGSATAKKKGLRTKD